MRHGEQQPPNWIDSIPDPKLRKIRMMQDPNIRFPELTMIAVGDGSNLTIFPKGVLSEVA